MICYYAGSTGSSAYKAVGLRWKQRHNAMHHPDLVPNSYDKSFFAEFMSPCMGHHDEEVAHAIGMPGAYDNGPCRIGWMTHLVTNWMGDDAFLKSLDIKLVRPNVIGNTTWCHGTVEAKEICDGDPVVHLKLWATDQDGHENTQGTATVVLASKGRQT
jgi:hypothetical protein